MELNLKWKLLLFGLLLVALTSHLGYLPLVFEEPRRAEVSIEMVINDNYIVPTINDTHYYNKPPFYNWLLIIVYKVFSTYNDWSVRVITIVSFLGLGAAVFVVTNKYSDRKSAWLAGFFTLTTGDILYRFSLSGEIDVFYSLVVFLQAIFIFHYYKRGNFWLLFIVSYVFCAIGFLTKGFTSPAFQVFTLLGWAFGFGHSKKLVSIQHFSGILVFTSIIAIYFIVYSGYNDPSIFILNLISESSQRTVSDSSFLNNLGVWAGFPLKLVSVTLPWLIVLILLNRARLKELWKNDLVKFSMLFIGSNILIYWISPGTRPRYLYPFIPFVLIVSAIVTSRYYGKIAGTKVLEYLWGGLIALLTLGFAIAPFFAISEEIEYPNLIGLVFTLLFGGLLAFYYKINQSRIWFFILALIILRFAFNFIVLPVRKADIQEEAPYHQMVEDIVDRSGGEKVWLYAPESIQKISPSLFGIEFPERSYNAIPWPSYQISYYLASRTGHILSYDNSSKNGHFYLAEKKYLDEENIIILNSYYIPGKKREFILYKYIK